jgi:hypothetical protein
MYDDGDYILGGGLAGGESVLPCSSRIREAYELLAGMAVPMLITVATGICHVIYYWI